MREDFSSTLEKLEGQKEIKTEKKLTECTAEEFFAVLKKYETAEISEPRILRDLNNFLREADQFFPNETAVEKEKRSQKVNAAKEVLDRVYEKMLPKEKPEMFKKFSKEDLDLIFQNLMWVELTKGCSVGCDFCALSVGKGIKEQMDFSTLVYLAREFKDQIYGHRLVLYAGSEPLDYRSGHYDFEDAFELINFYNQTSGYAFTAYPKGSKEVFLRMAQKNRLTLSLSHMNLKRLLEDNVFQEITVEERDGQKEITYGYSEEFKKAAGETNLPQVRNFIPFEKGKFFGPSLEEGDQRTRKAGRGGKEGEEFEKGIGCSFSVVLTSDGFLNEVQVKASGDFPTGELRVKIEEIKGAREMGLEKAKNLKEILPYGCLESIEAYGLNTQEGGTYGVTFLCRDGKYFIVYEKGTANIKKITKIDPAEKSLSKRLETHVDQFLLSQDWSREHFPNRLTYLFDDLTQYGLTVDKFDFEGLGLYRNLESAEKNILRRIKQAQGDFKGKNILSYGIDCLDVFDRVMGYEYKGKRPANHTEAISPAKKDNLEYFGRGFTLSKTDEALIKALGKGPDDFLELSKDLGKNFTHNYSRLLKALGFNFPEDLCGDLCLKQIMEEHWLAHLEAVLKFTRTPSLNEKYKPAAVSEGESQKMIEKIRGEMKTDFS